MVVVIRIDEQWPFVIVCKEGSVIHLIKVRVNQPAVVVIAAACVDVLERRKKERSQKGKARLYGRDTTHPAIDCS